MMNHQSDEAGSVTREREGEEPKAIDRRTFLGGLAAGAVLARPSSADSRTTTAGPAAVPRTSGPVVTAGAGRSDPAARPDAERETQRESLVMDAMGELRREYDDALLGDMLGSGMDSITVTLSDPKFEGAQALATAIDGLLDYDRLIAERPRRLLRATSVADVDRARREGKLAVFYLYQNTTQFGEDLDRVDMFHGLGLRSCQLTYNDSNLAGSGCRATGRLTEFGRRLIDRMNQRRMLLDLSHVNMETMADAIAASGAPAIISHTGCAAIHEHVRNTTDVNLRALAGRGGVVGICQIRPFITDRKTDNLDAWIDHIEHAVNVAGMEHVCIGSDRDHRVIELTPEYIAELKREEGPQFSDADLPLFLEALNGPRRMEVIRDALSKRRYGAADVDRIMGGNLYRLYQDVIG
jgi:membrane dipeptidase